MIPTLQEATMIFTQKRVLPGTNLHGTKNIHAAEVPPPPPGLPSGPGGGRGSSPRQDTVSVPVSDCPCGRSEVSRTNCVRRWTCSAVTGSISCSPTGGTRARTSGRREPSIAARMRCGICCRIPRRSMRLAAPAAYSRASRWRPSGVATAEGTLSRRAASTTKASAASLAA